MTLPDPPPKQRTIDWGEVLAHVYLAAVVVAALGIGTLRPDLKQECINAGGVALPDPNGTLRPDLKQECINAGGVALPDPNGKRVMWRCALPGEARP